MTDLAKKQGLLIVFTCSCSRLANEERVPRLALKKNLNDWINSYLIIIIAIIGKIENHILPIQLCL